MSGVLHRVKQRLGPLWWYAVILFCVQRLGDMINMYIGLYLVPKYVSQDELGAVLPLTNVGALLALPLVILMVPYKKFLNTYATRGEYGKVKRLMLDMLVLSGILTVATIVYARVIMPFVFERVRVVNGALGLLIVASGLVGTLAPVFSSALEALKRFRLIAVMTLIAAPLRLCVLLVAMPIRGLSGYFAGRIAPDLVGVGLAVWRLVPILGKRTVSAPYMKADGGAMVRYAGRMAVFTACGTVVLLAEAFVIRHRLPGIESAGYYMVSRFAEIGNYLGNTVIGVLFPLVAERHERGLGSARMLNQSLAVILAGGVFLTLGFHIGGEKLLASTASWREYAAFAPQMVVLSGMLCMRSVSLCYITHELACRRFAYVYFCSCVYLVEVVALYGLTGYTFFRPYLPAAAMEWMAQVNPGRLGFVLQLMFFFSVVNLLGIAVHRRRGDWWRRTLPAER